MPHPKDRAAQTLSFQVRPGDEGAGYEVRIFRPDRARRYTACYANTLAEVLEHFTAHLDDFFSIDAIIDADPDVAGACCPACEDRSIEANTSLK